MYNLVPYLVKLSISLSIVYLFYQLCLRRLTFYNWNRWFLLLYSAICFVIPFINIVVIYNENELQQNKLEQYIPSLQQIAAVKPEPVSTAFDWNRLSMIILLTGIGLMVIRLLIQFYSLWRIRSKAKLLYNSTVKLYHIDKPLIPFSFGKAIFINQHQHSQQELSEIIRHEFIHVKQKHTVDMIFSELLCILNWYNPFAWLLRKSIRQNLEFIADHQVLQTGLDRKQYQYLLLKVIGTSSYSVASNFNFSSLKKRIAMMNKTKSARVNVVRFAFALPLLVIVCLAFRTVVQKPAEANITISQDLQPAPAAATPAAEPKPAPTAKSTPVAAPTPVADTTPARRAYTMPDDVQSVHIEKTVNRITVTLKNGKTEVYNLDNEKEKKAFEDKYGGIPKAPVPPSAPAIAGVAITPAAPVTAQFEGTVAYAAPATPAAPKPAGTLTIDYKTPPAAPKPPKGVSMADIDGGKYQGDNCWNKKGYCVTVADNVGEFIVLVRNKEMKIIEAVPLNDWNANKSYEEKYGNIPYAVFKARPAKAGVPIGPKDTVITVTGKPATIMLHNLKPTKPVEVIADTITIMGEPVTTKALNATYPVSIMKDKPMAQTPPQATMEAIINKYTTREAIDDLNARFQQFGYTLSVNEFKTANGYLQSVKGKVSRNDGRGYGEFGNDDLSGNALVRLTVAKYRNEEKVLSIRSR